MNFRPASHVLELFTSQGCSSCPPADQLLQSITDPSILRLSFHVDYWNYLGWTDPFSNKYNTRRQSLYRDKLMERTMYTPQLVLNGIFGCVGSNHMAVEKGLASSKLRHAVSIQDGKIVLNVQNVPIQVILVEYYLHRTTKVMRGECAGRVLTNRNVVISVQLVSNHDSVAEPLDGMGVAVIVQRSDTLQVLGAVFSESEY